MKLPSFDYSWADDAIACSRVVARLHPLPVCGERDGVRGPASRDRHSP